MRVKIRKFQFKWLAAMILIANGFTGCTFFEEYAYVRKVEQTDLLICIGKEKHSAAYKVRENLDKAELYRYGSLYKLEGFPNLVIRDCSALSPKLMSIQTDSGDFFLIDEKGNLKVEKLKVDSGDLSNDLHWFVTNEKRINALTGEEISFKTKLPGRFLGNSPDWKTMISEGETLVDKDLITLYIVDVETGLAQEKFIRRSNYLWMNDRSHQYAGVVANNLWISNQFRWLTSAAGKDELVYPLLEKDEVKK